MKKSEIICDACCFYDPSWAPTHAVCKRYPPIPEDEDGANFPIVGPEDWCGEFKYGEMKDKIS